jgi:hypothetical protein
MSMGNLSRRCSGPAEAILGVYVLEARDLDHAIALARMTPVVDGGVEVRPMNGFEVR